MYLVFLCELYSVCRADCFRGFERRGEGCRVVVMSDMTERDLSLYKSCVLANTSLR